VWKKRCSGAKRNNQSKQPPVGLLVIQTISLYNILHSHIVGGGLSPRFLCFLRAFFPCVCVCARACACVSVQRNRGLCASLCVFPLRTSRHPHACSCVDPQDVAHDSEHKNNFSKIKSPAEDDDDSRSHAFISN